MNNDVQAVRSSLGQPHFDAISDNSNSPNLSAVKVRRAVPEDAEVCSRICYEAFTMLHHHYQVPPDFSSVEVAIGLLHMLFSHPQFYCVVAEIDGQIVGSNCMDERSTIGGIGPISIAPNAQNRSIGRLLMRAIMNRVAERGFAGMRLLQTTFHNRSLSLYAKLGFDARELIALMHGAPIKQSLPGWTVRPANAGDLEPAARLCERVHGFNRTGELSDGILQKTAVVVERQGRMTGYASDLGFFGHTIGESNLDLQALIGAAETLSGSGILVPTRNSALFRWCLESELRVVYSLTLMTIGLYNEPTGAYLPSVLY